MSGDDWGSESAVKRWIDILGGQQHWKFTLRQEDAVWIWTRANIETWRNTCRSLPGETLLAGWQAGGAILHFFLMRSDSDSLFFSPPHPLFSAASSPSWSRLFEARGGQEFQELAVVWHEAWKKPENKTKGGNGGEVRRGEGKEAGLPGQHVMTKGWRGGGLQKGKGRVGKGGVRGKYRQENERYTGKNLYKE